MESKNIMKRLIYKIPPCFPLLKGGASPLNPTSPPLKGSSNNPKFVTPVKTGVQLNQGLLDSDFRRNDIFRGSLKLRGGRERLKQGEGEIFKRKCLFSDKWIVDNQRGMALVIALIMLLVLTLVGLSAISTTSFEANIAGNQRVYNVAFYTADGGIENFRGRVSGGEFVHSNLSTFSYQVSIGGNTSEVRVWRNVDGIIKDRSDASGEYAVFKVVSEGRGPFPSRGKVEIESIIEVLNTQREGYN